MKLLNIFGAVVAVHIAVLVFAFAIPGCRSTSPTTAEPAPVASTGVSEPATVGGGIALAPELSDRDLNPPLATAGVPDFDPNAPAVAVPAGAGRYSPTRPHTQVATALQPQEVTTVTPASTYTVARGDNLWALSRRHGISVRELAAANDLRPDAMLKLGQVLVIPGQAAPAVTADAGIDDPNVITYEIKSGDSLGLIARRHGTTVAKLKAYNNLRSDLVRAGDTLAIPPAPDHVAPPATAGNTAAGTSTPASTSTSTSTPAVTSRTYRHVVKPGESLTLIARQYEVRVGEIALANKIRDPGLIRPGQELLIPGWEAAPETTAPVTPAPQTPAPGATNLPPAGEDLDFGLDDDAADVPVIQVEDEPVRTIGVGSGGPAGSPPQFN